MRIGVVDGVDCTVDFEQCDGYAVYIDDHARPRGEFRKFGDADEFGHGVNERRLD